jgi:hypothetical protein
VVGRAYHYSIEVDGTEREAYEEECTVDLVKCIPLWQRASSKNLECAVHALKPFAKLCLGYHQRWCDV